MTPEQKLHIQRLFTEARLLADAIPLEPDLETFESTHRSVSEARVAIGRLDSLVFRLYGELYHMQHPQSIVYTPKVVSSQPFTVDDL
jgi:hypothetical protein